jgi:20S proteasome alpha/beta subunit
MSQGRGLTYILAGRCTDGIALIGDRKVTRSGMGSTEYEDKIFSDVKNVVIAASGVTGLFDKFRRQISHVARTKPDIEVADFIGEAEKIVYKLNSDYYERTRSGIDLLVAYGRIFHGQLQHVTMDGVAEEVRRCQALGSGRPYGAYLLRSLWRDDLTMKQLAVIGCTILRHIEDNELEETVGVGKTKPQVWFVPDWPTDMTAERYKELPKERQVLLDTRQISTAELVEIEKGVTAIYPKIGESLGEIKL